MMKMDRTLSSPPTFYLENIRIYTDRWIKRLSQWQNNRTRKNPPKFDWYQVNWEKNNIHLINILLKCTQNHCAFCDAWPMGRISPSVEHFRPKTQFPKMAYMWENLFPSCFNCQTFKGERFDENLLDPSHGEFSFERYFWFDTQTGELNPLKSLTDDDRVKVETTIELYGLNKTTKDKTLDRCLDRLYEMSHLNNLKSQGVTWEQNDICYRFLSFYHNS